MTSTPVSFLDLAALHAPLRASFDVAIRRVLDSNHFILGSEVDAFEAAFAEYIGTPHCLGVGNGLDALKIALEALGIRPGDEVIVPGQTFVATWLAVSALGAVPVPADVDLATGQVDPAAVEAAITPRTTAVVAVHLYGALAPMRELREIATRHSLALVEDAAQAHGARLDGRRVGTLGDVAAFSFYPGKNLGALGDGGALVTARDDVAERARLLRNYGSSAKYQHDAKGWNSRLDDLQAAVLAVKLPHLDAWNDRRRQIADRYRAELGEVAPTVEHVTGSEPVHHLYPVRLDGRWAVQQHLRELGVETGVHYPVAPADTGAYSDVDGALLPNSRTWAEAELSLPIDPTLTDDQVTQVISSVRVAVGSLVRA